MKRKLAMNASGVASKGSALKLQTQTDVAVQRLPDFGSLGLMLSPAEDSQTAQAPVAVSDEWIA
jgi:hypothetical protein